ncbi:MAG: HupE/UreJ family protein [Nitrospiraceae bacterium]|nr:MAG: HupE/UreJ family protein [Nitrospiraceae bacterium]
MNGTFKTRVSNHETDRDSRKADYRIMQSFEICLFEVSKLFRISRSGFRISQAVSFVLFLLAFNPSPADAHLVNTGFGTFYDGVVHLFITPSDILVAIGLGLLAGLCGAAASRGVIVALPAAWLAGEMVGSIYPTAITLPWVTTLSFGIVGVLVALNATLPRTVMLILTCTAGLLHGFVNGSTMAAAGTNRLGMLGAALAVFIVITLITALVVSLRAQWSRIVVRVAGSWIAAVGLLMLGWLVKGQG